MTTIEELNYKDQDIIGSRLRQELPEIKIIWKRGREPFDYMKALIYLVLGKKGSGKSALLELLSLRYPKIVDLFASKDDEGLCYCRKNSPIDDILLIHGDNVDLNCSWDTVSVSNLTLKKMLEYEAIIPSYSFFINESGRFLGIETILKSFWRRREWKKPIFVTVREASSFIYSRVKQQGVNMKMAKADFIFWQREMRHFGYALGIDTIRWHSVDKEMRDLADHLIIKKLGYQGLPKDIDFLYRYSGPWGIAGCPPDRFLLLTESGAIGHGQSELPVFHKEEGIDLLKELGIEIEYGEPIELGRGMNLGDKEHDGIIKAYYATGCTSMMEASKATMRSKATVSIHIGKHNKDVKELGKCPRCNRVNSEFADVIIPIGRRKDMHLPNLEQNTF